jgi:CubicO group peptidase (beta-lactamase class C family)
MCKKFIGNSNINYTGSFMSLLVVVIGIVLPACTVPAQNWPTNGWETAKSPESGGMNVAALADFHEWFTETKTANTSSWGYLIVRNGKIVAESYGNGGGVDVRWDIGSIRKPVSSAILGMAIKEGRINLDDPISKVWPSSHPGYIDGTTIRCYFNISVACTPVCNCFYYDNCYFTYAGQILGSIYKTKDLEIAPLANDMLVPVLGLKDTEFFHAPVSESCGKMVYKATLRDAAKFGYLWLNKGKWEGRELFTEEFAKTATSHDNPVREGGDYGLCWFVNEEGTRLPDSPADVFWHIGNGFDNTRAILAVFPSKNMILVLRSDASAYDFIGRNYRTNSLEVNEIIKRIAAAAK